MPSSIRKMCGFTSSCTCVVSSEYLLSSEIFYSIQWFCGKQRPWLDSVDAQSGLGLRCLHMPEDTFSQSEAYKISITKTRLYNFDPLKPHFYIVKLGFTGVCIIFIILLKNIDCWYSLEPPRRGGSNEYPQSMFGEKNMKNIRIFLSENFPFFGCKIFNIFEYACFRNAGPSCSKPR